MQNEGLEKCANCGTEIGNLQSAWGWKSRAVCSACWHRLKSEERHQGGDFFDSAIHTKVAGVSFDDHQDNIEFLEDGETLDLVREPSNP